MATRDRQSMDLIWCLVDLTSSRMNQALTAAEDLTRERLPAVDQSVNRNISLTQALVKVAGTGDALLAALPPPARAAILRVFTEADHDEARALVTAVEWTGPQEEEV